jgi:hypothetical protein
VPGVHEVEIKMKRIIPIVCSLLAVSAGAFAQDAAIDKPLMAAPAQLKAGAGVIKWKADYTYDTLKAGTNNLVCYDKSGMPGVQQAIYEECTNKGNLPRIAQNLKFEAIADKAASKAAFDKAEADGSRVKPEFGSVFYHVMGADPDHLRTHMTIAVPGATTATIGLPSDNKSGGVWIMNAGTTTAHLMTPGE